MAKTFSYGKTEKLKSRKLIEELFAGGKQFSVFPLKVTFKIVKEPLDFPVKAGVTVSGRNFKKAVQRNRIKRILREAYRTEKLPLHEAAETGNKQIAFFIIYIDKALPEYLHIKNKMTLVIRRLIKELHEVAVENN